MNNKGGNKIEILLVLFYLLISIIIGVLVS